MLLVQVREGLEEAQRRLLTAEEASEEAVEEAPEAGIAGSSDDDEDAVEAPKGKPSSGIGGFFRLSGSKIFNELLESSNEHKWTEAC